MKKSFALLLICSLGLTLTACGAQQRSNVTQSVTKPQPNSNATEAVSTPTTPETTNVKLNVPIGAAIPMPSETKKLPVLEKLLIDTWHLPKSALAGTRYYYNYADLNGDGVDELLALAVGEYTSGSGGSPVLIAMKDGNVWKVLQSLSLVQPPLIISNEETGGWKNLLVHTNDPSVKNGYRVLKWDGKHYPNTADGDPLDSIDDQTGTAIFYNDLAADLENGNALTLGQPQGTPAKKDDQLKK